MKKVSIALRVDQWDLTVFALQHTRYMTTGSEAIVQVDKLGRQFLKRCIDEIVHDIRLVVPEGNAK